MSLADWPDFVFPGGLEAGALEVLEGEYDIPDLTFDRIARLWTRQHGRVDGRIELAPSDKARPAPLIIDIGANCGAFTYWARKKRFPGCEVLAVEPHPRNIDVFNINNPHGKDGVTLWGCAISARFGGEGRAILYDGVDGGAAGSGQASLDCRGGQKRDRTFEVKALHPASLPPCDILKIDGEGIELEVVTLYRHIDTVAAVMLEFHHRDDRFYIGSHLQQHGLRFVSEKVDRGGHSGVLRFARQDFLSVCKVCRLADGRRQGFLRADGLFECQNCEEVFK